MPALPWGPPGRGQDPNWVSDKVGEQPSITSCHCQSYHAFPCTFFSLSFCLETTQLGPVFCPLLLCGLQNAAEVPNDDHSRSPASTVGA